MDESPSLLGTPREWAQDLGLATLIGLFLGVIGPFGSFYGGSIELRVPYWIGNLWIGFVILALTTRLSIRGAARFDVPVWFAVAAGVAVGSFPLCVALSFFSAWFWPGNHGHIGHILELYGQTLAISEPCAFGYYWLGSRKGHNPPLLKSGPAAASQEPTPSPVHEAPPSDPPSAEGFLSRLPSRLGRDLLCLQMEDHYVRAHTTRGSDLILTSLKDAIAELGAVEGMQVHRSWWVAHDAVSEPMANGRNLFLRLSNGVQVPVSRASVAKLKSAGWIK